MGCTVMETFRSSLATIWCMKKVTFLLSLSILAGCQSGNDTLIDFQKLEGTWVSTDPTGKFVEQWKGINDTLMEGTSYMILKGDTVFSENLKLILQGESVHYIPTVPGENDGKAVRFTLTTKKLDSWIFENPSHDFPQQIIYNFKEKDSLIATVQGKDNGQFRKLEFRMKRSK